jgi:hypothetical protein
MKFGKYLFSCKKKILLIFIGLFIPKNEFRESLFVGRNLYRRYLSRLKGFRFEISATLRQLGWIDESYTQIFGILKSLEQTQETKQIKIT